MHGFSSIGTGHTLRLTSTRLRSQPSGSALQSAVLLGLLLLAGALRLYHLAAESIWFDEAASISQANRPFWDMIAATARDNYPPLHNILLYLFIQAFGLSEFTMRLPSVIAGWLCCLVFYLLGKELFGTKVGLLSLALIAILPFHIYYSQEARMYTLFLLFAATSTLMLAKSTRAPTGLHLSGYALSNAALLYSHYFASFTLVAQTVFILYLTIRRYLKMNSALKIAAALALSAASFVPWIAKFANRAYAVQHHKWIGGPALYSLYAKLGVFAGAKLLVIPGLALAGLAVYQALRPVTGVASPRRAWVIFLASWLAWLLLAQFGLSWVSPHVSHVRYLIPALVPWCLLLALGMVTLSSINQFAFAISMLVFFGVVGRKLDYLPSKTDARHAVAFVNQHAGARDAVAVPGRRAVVFEYYNRRFDVPLFTVPIKDASDRSRLLALRGIWVVAFRTGCTGEFGEVVEGRKLDLRRNFLHMTVCYFR